MTLIRRHMVQTHTLRLSNAEREEKTAQLYSFITSERCTQLLDRIDTQAGRLAGAASQGSEVAQE